MAISVYAIINSVSDIKFQEKNLGIKWIEANSHGSSASLAEEALKAAGESGIILLGGKSLRSNSVTTYFSANCGNLQYFRGQSKSDFEENTGIYRDDEEFDFLYKMRGFFDFDSFSFIKELYGYVYNAGIKFSPSEAMIKAIYRKYLNYTDEVGFYGVGKNPVKRNVSMVNAINKFLWNIQKGFGFFVHGDEIFTPIYESLYIYNITIRAK